MTLALGVPFVLISIAARTLPADVLTGARFALAAATLLAITWARRGSTQAFSALARLLSARPVDVLLVGLCSAALPSILITVGEHHMPTGLTSLLLATTPMWIAMGSPLLFPTEHLGARRTACLVVALCGTAFMTADNGAHGSMLWAALPLAAAMSYAAGNLLVRFRLRDVDAFTLTCAQMTVAVVITAPFAARHLSAVRWEPGPWAAVLALGVLCSGLGWLANTALVQRVSAVQASLVSFTAPVVAMLLGTIVLSERLSLPQLAAAGIVTVAIAAFGVLSRPTRQPDSHREVGAIPELAILGFLAETPMHAYELRKRITKLVGHVRPVSDGSLHPALERLRRKGLVTSTPAPSSDGPARQVFELTDAGRTELEHRLAHPDDPDIHLRFRAGIQLTPPGAVNE
ncbi:EamA family transporter [Paractinoplanes globisporus]|uniref:EamA family transporter n=1 Tax=Paractinoplanes globisporus TaxID=113565 RepID=A0ABW6WKB8_9ACTN|nr:EamA family transporter [Actinoplanes globisporus]